MRNLLTTTSSSGNSTAMIESPVFVARRTVKDSSTDFACRADSSCCCCCYLSQISYPPLASTNMALFLKSPHSVLHLAIFTHSLIQFTRIHTHTIKNRFPCTYILTHLMISITMTQGDGKAIRKRPSSFLLFQIISFLLYLYTFFFFMVLSFKLRGKRLHQSITFL